MKYHELKTEAKQKKRRAGRGISAGRGKTAGRGTKGQSSRAGGPVRPGFEGGQNPLTQRIPKLKGFKGYKQQQTVYTSELEGLKGEVDNFKLDEANLIRTPYEKVKVIKKGQLKSAVKLSTQAASESAVKQIEKAGGTFKAVDIPKRKPKAKSTK